MVKIMTENEHDLHHLQLTYIKLMHNDTEPFIKRQNYQLLAVSDTTFYYQPPQHNIKCIRVLYDKREL